MPPVNDAERDLMIRTIIGEAANQPSEGQAAVAHTILNRARDGSFGSNISRVILAPNAFEPWSTRAGELAVIPRNSKVYQQVGEIVDRARSGELPDPTNGATHFLQEDIVRQRRGGTLPDWAQGPGQRIGAHTFFNPNQKTAMNEKVPDYLNLFLTDSSAQAQKLEAKSSKTPDYLTDFVNAAPVQGAVEAQPVAPQLSMPPIPPANGIIAQPSTEPSSSSEFMDRTVRPIMRAMTDVPSGIPIYDEKIKSPLQSPVKDYANRASQLFGENAAMIGEGAKDIAGNRTATGIGKVGLGALGYLFSPIQAIDKPIEKLTGNKEFAERATMMVPSATAGRIINEVRPKITALKDVVRDIGSENLPQVIARLEANPKLTLMDVAPAVRGNAAGLATDPRNVSAMTHLNEFQRERMSTRKGETLNAFEDVLGATPNVKELSDSIIEKARKTGKEMIEPAVANAKPVNVSSAVAKLDSQLPPDVLKELKGNGKTDLPMSDVDKRIWSLRQRLGGKGEPKELDPQTAHEIAMELRRTSSDPQLGYQARELRRDLVNSINEASGGKYKPGLKQYADDKVIKEALNHGFEVFSNPTAAEKSLANHPDNWKAWYADASAAEKEAVAKGILLGARSRIMNMRKGIDIPEGSFVHERIAAIVGEKEANKIVKTLNDWRDIASTDNLLTQNSATALRLAGQANRAVPDARSTKDILSGLAPGAIVGGAAHMLGGQNPILTGAMTLAGIAGGKLKDVAKKSHAISSNTAYAQWASATGQKKEDLLVILREAAARSDPSSSGQKLINIAPPSILQALPR